MERTRTASNLHNDPWLLPPRRSRAPWQVTAFVLRRKGTKGHRCLQGAKCQPAPILSRYSFFTLNTSSFQNRCEMCACVLWQTCLQKVHTCPCRFNSTDDVWVPAEPAARRVLYTAYADFVVNIRGVPAVHTHYFMCIISSWSLGSGEPHGQSQRECLLPSRCPAPCREPLVRKVKPQFARR